jgi:choline kinase
MRALILAAGVGRRLHIEKPKCLLEFGGETLLHRHLDLLRLCGVDHVTLAVGHKAADIESALATRVVRISTHVVYNPNFAQGSMATLWCLRESLCAGGDILLMDADVLYDRRMIARLTTSSHRNCFLLDRDFEGGDEPVKLCVRDGRLVEFRKQVDVAFDYCGESVGFFRLSDNMAKKLIDAAKVYLDKGLVDEPYEEALRDVLLLEPDAFGFEDITGLPWTEIDFPSDVERARLVILPKLIDGDRH